MTLNLTTLFLFSRKSPLLCIIDVTAIFIYFCEIIFSISIYFHSFDTILPKNWIIRFLAQFSDFERIG